MFSKRGIITLFYLLLPAGISGQSAVPVRDPIAVVGGQTIYEQDLLPLIQSQITQLRAQEYELRSKYLDALINQRLAEAEAKRRNLTLQELMNSEVNSKVADPTDADVRALYDAQKDRINRPFEDVKAQIRQSLKEAKLQTASEAYFKVLRGKAGVEVLLDPPRAQVAVDATRVRGKADAPVTIVEFSDFQCPFCMSAEATLRSVLAKYDGKVRLAFRDYPLREMHPQADPAATAARCAGEQGKFWEFHDLVFVDQAKLSPENLAEHMRALKMDSAKFDACMKSGKFKEKIDQDIQEANRLGVSGTPGFFVNGIFLNGAQPAAVFEKVIEGELSLAKRRAK